MAITPLLVRKNRRYLKVSKVIWPEEGTFNSRDLSKSIDGKVNSIIWITNKHRRALYDGEDFI